MYWIDKLRFPEEYFSVKEQIERYNPHIKRLNSTMPLDEFYFIAQAYINNDSDVFRGKSLDNAVLEWYIKQNFSKYKQVYMLNPQLYNRLIQTKGLEEITTDIIKKIPFDTLYIDTTLCNITLENKPIDGVFVGVEKNTNKGELNEQVILVVKHSNNFTPLALEFGKKVTTAIETKWETNYITSVSELKEIFINLLQVVLYLCCDKKDVVKLRTSKKKHSGIEKKLRIKEITYNQVGFVIGETFSDERITYRYIDGTKDGKGKEKAPHFRSPHWATYHVGKGRTETILKWIDLIYVNGGSDAQESSQLPVTLHKMK